MGLGEMDLEALVRPVVESGGLEFVEVEFHRQEGRRVLRVTVDREGGVDLDTIALASGRISRRLELEGFRPGPYQLEVSSPGLERPLKEPRDFARRVGEKVKMKMSEPMDGSRTVTGVIAGADERQVRLVTEAGERSVEFGRIASAWTVFEWGSAGRERPGKKQARGGTR
jgi:ribosome maturation factor RimP